MVHWWLCREGRLPWKDWRSVQTLVIRAVRCEGTVALDCIDDELTNFIKRNTNGFVRWAEDRLSLMWRNLASRIGLLVCLLLIVFVEQLHALLFERWWYGLAAVSPLVPVLGLLGLAHYYRKSVAPRRLRWLLSFLRIRFLWRPEARFPTGYDVLALEPRAAKRIAWAAVAKALAFAGWMLLAAQFFGLFREDWAIVTTLGQTVSIVSVGITCLSLLDLWDFIHPAPIRRLFLSLAAVLWLIYSLGDLGVWLFAGASVAVAWRWRSRFWSIARAPTRPFSSQVPRLSSR